VRIEEMHGKDEAGGQKRFVARTMVATFRNDPGMKRVKNTEPEREAGRSDDGDAQNTAK